MKKKILLFVIIILFLISLITTFGVIMKYNYVKRLCRDIKDGVSIQTKIADATTAPIFMDHFYTILTQGDGVLIPLVEACRWGNEQAIKALIENGADPNFTVKGYWTAVEAIAHSNLSYNKQLEMLQLLYDAGADINAFSSYVPIIQFYTEKEIYCAPDSDRAALIMWLLDHGAVSDMDNGGNLLHYVARGANSSLLESLIKEYSLDVNQSGHENQTPLIAAVAYPNEDVSLEEQIEVISTLLKYGADKSLKDFSGKTAYDYAAEQGNTRLMEILK